MPRYYFKAIFQQMRFGIRLCAADGVYGMI